MRKRLRHLRETLGRDISTPAGRRRARLHFLWLDHGILRTVWKNFHQLDEGVYRSNQPSPRRLEQFRDMGIRTILNLRGESENSQYLFEAEACERLGLRLVNHRIYATDLAEPEEYLGLIDLLGRLEKPFVMHCKSGADRTGVAAVFYLHVIRGVPLAEAMKQFHWRYVHLRASRNGILDFMFETYRRQGEPRGRSLVEWLRHDYDPAALRQAFRAGRRGARA